MQQGRRHRAEQIIRLLQEADVWLASGKTLAEVCQHLAISVRSYYLWRRRYGGLEVQEAKRLTQLERENQRLKQLLAEAELDKAILKEAVRGN